MTQRTRTAFPPDPSIVLRGTAPVPPSRLADGLCWAQVVVSGVAVFGLAALFATLQFAAVSAWSAGPSSFAVPGRPLPLQPGLW